jgi:hypothetical protein
MKAKQGAAIVLAVLILVVPAVSTVTDSLLGLWEVLALDAEEMLVMTFPLRYEAPACFIR